MDPCLFPPPGIIPNAGEEPGVAQWHHHHPAPQHRVLLRLSQRPHPSHPQLETSDVSPCPPGAPMVVFIPHLVVPVCGPCLPPGALLHFPEAHPQAFVPHLVSASAGSEREQATSKEVKQEKSPNKDTLNTNTRDNKTSSVDEKLLKERAFEDYMAILDSTKSDQNREGLQTKDANKEEEEQNASFLEYLDELCSDEDFIRKVESLLHTEYMDSLLSSDLEPIDLHALEGLESPPEATEILEVKEANKEEEEEEEEEEEKILEYLEERCSDEDFVRKVESQLHSEYLNFILSSDLDHVDLLTLKRPEVEEHQPPADGPDPGPDGSSLVTVWTPTPDPEPMDIETMEELLEQSLEAMQQQEFEQRSAIDCAEEPATPQAKSDPPNHDGAVRSEARLFPSHLLEEPQPMETSSPMDHDGSTFLETSDSTVTEEESGDASKLGPQPQDPQGHLPRFIANWSPIYSRLEAILEPVYGDTAAEQMSQVSGEVASSELGAGELGDTAGKQTGDKKEKKCTRRSQRLIGREEATPSGNLDVEKPKVTPRGRRVARQLFKREETPNEKGNENSQTSNVVMTKEGVEKTRLQTKRSGTERSSRKRKIQNDEEPKPSPEKKPRTRRGREFTGKTARL